MLALRSTYLIRVSCLRVSATKSAGGSAVDVIVCRTTSTSAGGCAMDEKPQTGFENGSRGQFGRYLEERR